LPAAADAHTAPARAAPSPSPRLGPTPAPTPAPTPQSGTICRHLVPLRAPRPRFVPLCGAGEAGAGAGAGREGWRWAASVGVGSVREVTGAAPNPWFSWDYVQANWGDITEALGQHVALTVQAVAVAAVV